MLLAALTVVAKSTCRPDHTVLCDTRIPVGYILGSAISAAHATVAVLPGDLRADWPIADLAAVSTDCWTVTVGQGIAVVEFAALMCGFELAVAVGRAHMTAAVAVPCGAHDGL